VTLIVNTKDAESIELASTFGRPRLVLRGTADTERTESAGVTSAELTGQAIPAAPVGEQETGWAKVMTALLSHGPQQPQQAPVRWPVQIIRGNNESTIFYELKAKAAGQTGSDGERWVTSGAAHSTDDKPAEKNEVR